MSKRMRVHLTSWAKGMFCSPALAFAVLTALMMVGAGCSRQSSDQPAKTSEPAGQKSAQVETEPIILSEGDAAMLKGKGTNTEADLAWEALAKAIQTPPQTPAEWETKEPTEDEMARFQKTNGVFAAKLADKARDFYTRFPNHENAAEARKQEYALLGYANKLGNSNSLERLRQIEDARLKDPSLSEDDRLELRMQQLQRASINDQETNVTVTLTQVEKATRALQKEFPKRPEVTSLLLSVAQGWLDNGQPEQSRKLAQEVAEASSDDEVKASAQELLKKIGRIGKPLDLKFKAVDGRELDLQKMTKQVVLIDFWATWCGPCMAELPKVKAAYQQLHSQGFEILGISFDREKSDLEKVLTREKISWPQCFDEGEEGKKLGDQFGITGIPTMWLVDKKGVLREINAREGLVEKVKNLLAEP